MNKNILIGAIIGILLVGGGAFFGGMKYAQGSSVAAGRGNFANLTPEERQARLSQTGAARGSQGGARNGGFTMGEILSKDAQSITVKLANGGSRIVLFSTSTEVSKSAAGSINDLTIGEQALVSGTPNQDGSVTARTIQIGTRLPRGGFGN